MRVKWNFEKLKKEALKHKRRMDFAKYSYNAYMAALRKGILDTICAHMELPITEAYGCEELRIVALKYKTRKEFENLAYNAYQAAHRKGQYFFDSICSHMPKNVNDLKWSFDKLKKEAQKHNSRSEFRDFNPAAAQAAVRRGIYEEICSKMKPPSGTSRPERELLEVIKNYFPHAKKDKDMKVKIAEKSYIKGFEIDILVGIAGIEFDGEYNHSFERMRKDKRKIKWSNEDIRNYHEIKDSWFASKGIQILHIKEEDWIKDKEDCIKKCLDFIRLSNITAKNPVSLGSQI